MAIVTFSNNPVAEARALVETLSVWLVEQDEQPVRGSKTDFTYDDGTLRAVNITLDPEDGVE